MKNNHSRLPAERQQRILEILKEEFSIRSSNLSEMLGVSEMTIRRDFDLLEKQGLVERTHGGAVFRQERVAGKRVAGNVHYRNSIRKNPEEKQRIAKKAASMIAPNDIVYIGEGTTASMVVRFVEPAMPFTIFTNNIGVISEYQPVHNAAELVLLPGTYNPTTHALAGPLTIEMIQQVNATKVFLGADGLSLRAGLSTADLEIAVIERSMIQQTRGQVIVMADHPKFGLVAEISIVPLKHIDVLITNRKIPADFQKDLDKMGVQVVIT
ncbi:MAG: DeoR/GlpR family DNA-binding transcription regulator [Desulfobacterales bacterium]